MFPLLNIVDDLLPKEEPEHHPWERFIKDAYANKIKTAHNSINNPRYPKKKERDTENPIQKVKFTVIGNRVTKEFIYCINIVKGLHKYRKKCFEPPVIRGITSVDWPNVWNDIKIQYGGIAYCLKSQVVVFLDDKIVGGENELKELISEKYTYHLSLDYYHESVKQFAKFIKGSGRPTVFMHISIDDEHIGTMMFMLYADVVPYTCENFLRLCKATKGGYSGTPVHRIVKDGWIQCGGFGLKETDLDCENFIVPPDKRGVICMANAGRHIDCSTQFFVLLQPSPWMLHKYVAFGQLIDGDATLRKIENVATWYESPQQNITIYQAGIMNMDCKDTMVNQSAHEYLHGHVEDLFALAEVLWEEIIARVFLQLQIKENELLEAMEGEEEPASNELNLHATARFMKKGTAPGKSQKSKSQDEPKPSQAQIRSRSQSRPLDGSKSVIEGENNDFDVSEYQYEAEEEYIYEKQALIEVKESESLVVKPEKPYYIEFTDVPYPGEVSSEYNLKKVLLGDYCLEADVVPPVDPPKVATHCLHQIETFPAEFFEVSSQESSSSEVSLDSQQEAEIKVFLQNYTDSSSFAGELVRGIAHAKHVMDSEKATLTDDQLRQMRLFQKRLRKPSDEEHNRKVNIAVPSINRLPKQIKRRQTGFVKPESLIQESELDDVEKSVRIDPGAILSWAPSPKIMRRNTEFERPRFFDSEVDVHNWKEKPSALTRLFKHGETPSTLKDFGLTTVVEERSMMLKSSRINGNSFDTVEHYRQLSKEDQVPHPRKPRTSFESIKTSLRSVSFAKTRPCITVEEYQLKNKQYKEDMENKGDAKSIAGK